MQDHSVSTYLDKISRIPLMTAAEEIELGHAIQRMVQLRDKEDPTPQERRIIRAGLKAKRRMIEGNLRLVISIAKKWDFGIHLSMMDLIQEGSIGLDRAAEKFDPERGYKFSTYAYWWIRQSMSRALASSDRSIRLPSSAGDTIRKAQAFAVEYNCKHGAMPSISECAKHVKVSVDSLTHYMSHASGTASLDSALGVDNGGQPSSLIELVADQKVDHDEVIETSMELDAMFTAFTSLSDTHRKVLERVFALNGGEPETMTAISNELGCSRERVRQIKEIGLRKLRVKIAQVS